MLIERPTTDDGTDERVYETSKVSLEPVTGTMEMSNTAVPIGGTPNDITVQNTDELAHRQSGQQALTQSDQNSASHGLKTVSSKLILDNSGSHANFALGQRKRWAAFQ